MLNRPLDQLYPPGSTFKVITTAAALRDGLDPNIRLTAARSIALPDSTATLTNYGDQPCPGPSVELSRWPKRSNIRATPHSSTSWSTR